VFEGNMMFFKEGQARPHSRQRAYSSRESGLPTPSTPVGDKSRYES
jgi:hypothetical protein